MDQGVGMTGLGRSQVGSGFPLQPLHSKNSSSTPPFPHRAVLQSAGRAADPHIYSADAWKGVLFPFHR